MTIIEGFYVGTFRDNVFINDDRGKRHSIKASENLVSFIRGLYKFYEPIKLEIHDNKIKKIIL